MEIGKPWDCLILVSVNYRGLVESVQLSGANQLKSSTSYATLAVFPLPMCIKLCLFSNNVKRTQFCNFVSIN